MLGFCAVLVTCLAATLAPLEDARLEDSSTGEAVWTDFREAGVAERWITVNDNVMGGRSSGGPSFDGKTLAFAGVTNTNGGGFSSIRAQVEDAAFASSAGVWLRYRGDGRTYEVDLRLRDRRSFSQRPSYRAKFATRKGEGWQTVRIPFEAFRASWRGRALPREAPVDPAKIETLGLFIYDGISGAFRLEVDAIGMVPARMSSQPTGAPGREARKAKPVRGAASLARDLDALNARLSSGDARQIARQLEALQQGLRGDFGEAPLARRLYLGVVQSLAADASKLQDAALAQWLRMAARDARVDESSWARIVAASRGRRGDR